MTRASDDGAVEIAADGASRTIRAGRVVLAGGAVVTARLLMLSGLGNDWVGDCLQGHLYSGAFGLFDDVIDDGVGPGPSIATRWFAHGNNGIVGGGLLDDDFVKIPTVFHVWALPPDVDRTGPDARREMAESYRRTAHVMGPLQEVPVRTSRVRLAATVKDDHGLPVARLEGLQDDEDLRTAQFFGDRAEEWLRASGANRTWQMVPRASMRSGGQHQAGSTRMSDSPRHGATDPFGKVWGCDRLYVADGSLHVTNGGANPVLTILALAWRTAEHIATT